jgi:hypothetical protein
MRGVFQATIVDDEGSVVPVCNIEVRSEETGDLVQIYDAFEAGNLLGNPLQTDAEGFVRLYAEGDIYRVRAYLGGFERIWRHVIFGIGPVAEEADAAVAAAIASLQGQFDILEAAVGDLITDINTAIADFISTGSFTGTLTGMTSATTGTVHWRRAGDVVTLYAPSAIIGTSNTAAMSLTGLPAALASAQPRTVPCVVEDNGNTTVLAMASVDATPQVSFNLLTVSGSQVLSGAPSFTSSGAKGLPGGWSISYSVD